MDELKAKILQQVDAAGGQVLWKTVADSLTDSERRNIMHALRSLKADGLAQAQNVFDVDTRKVTFYIMRIGAGG